jgi:hypothetical protein
MVKIYYGHQSFRNQKLLSTEVRTFVMREILNGYTLNSGKVYMIRLYLGIQLDIYFKPKQR